jgi:hypothetical protein
MLSLSSKILADLASLSRFSLCKKHCRKNRVRSSFFTCSMAKDLEILYLSVNEKNDRKLNLSVE